MMEMIVAAAVIALAPLVYFGLTKIGVPGRLSAQAISAMARAAAGILKDKLYGYVLEAERKYGGGTGAVKLSAVLDAVTESAYYNALPAEVRQMLTSDEITALVEDVLEKKLKPAMQSNSSVQAIVAGGGRE